MGFTPVNPFTITTTTSDASPSATNTSATAGYRPPELNKVALWMITVPGTAVTPTAPTSDPITGAQTPPATSTQNTYFVFDGVLRSEHRHEARITTHPVQTGASIADHAYLLPVRVVLDVLMSDAMASYEAMWSGAPTKSISAFQTTLNWQKNRTLLTVSTRLKTYFNMLVEDVRATDTHESLYGLRMTVTFLGITSAAVQVSASGTAPISARPHTTDQTQIGPVTAQPVSPAIQSQHQVTPGPGVPGSNVPGAGTYSSNPWSGNNPSGGPG